MILSRLPHKQHLSLLRYVCSSTDISVDLLDIGKEGFLTDLQHVQTNLSCHILIMFWQPLLAREPQGRATLPTEDIPMESSPVSVRGLLLQSVVRSIIGGE